MIFAFLFPGQGAQKLGMMSGFSSCSIVQHTFEEASDTLSLDLWSLLQGEDKEIIARTEITQPLMLTVAVAVFRAYCNLGGKRPNYVTGHSLGEYSALVAAEVATFQDVLQVVKARACLMQKAVMEGQGAMAAILNLPEEKVHALCEQVTCGTVEVANINTPEQIVIAGEKKAVDQAAQLAKKQGARAILLSVSVPSHCSLMSQAAEKLARVLALVEFAEPVIPVIHNVSASTHNSPFAIKEALIKQLYSPVLWVKSMEYLYTQGVSEAVECAPTRVLTDLNKRMNHPLQMCSWTSVEDIASWLDQHQ